MGEVSPLFASHPHRAFEWYDTPVTGFKEEMIKTHYGFNAMVIGHTYSHPSAKGFTEENVFKLRRLYNIDFAMSSAYDREDDFGNDMSKSHGGWLVVREDSTIDIFTVDDQEKVGSLTFRYLEAAQQ
jgi:hypothetical protein